MIPALRLAATGLFLLSALPAFAATYAPANSLNTKGVADSTINEPLPTYTPPAPSGGGGGGGGSSGGSGNESGGGDNDHNGNEASDTSGDNGPGDGGDGGW